MSALTRDEVTAPHVNLVPLDLPGDLYKYVATHVWEIIEAEAAKMSPSEYQHCERVMAALADLKQQVYAAPQNSELRKQLVEELLDFKKEHDDLIQKAAVIFWRQFTDDKYRRKICKR